MQTPSRPPELCMLVVGAVAFHGTEAGIGSSTMLDVQARLVTVLGVTFHKVSRKYIPLYVAEFPVQV